MTGKELYEKYKGSPSKTPFSTGVICGYDSHHMIMSVTSGDDGWRKGKDDVICAYLNNKRGYLYVFEENILPFKSVIKKHTTTRIKYSKQSHKIY